MSITLDAETVERLKAQITVSPSEAAAITGTSVNTVRRAIADGTLPAHRIRRRVTIPTAAVVAWATGKAS